MIEESAENRKNPKAGKKDVLHGKKSDKKGSGSTLTFPAECVSRNKFFHIGTDTWTHPVEITGDYRNMGIPQGLMWMITHWRNEAKIDLRTFRPDCFEPEFRETDPRLQFVWFDDYYELPYYVLETTQEHFSCFAYKIVQELQQLGCPYTRYIGEPEQ